MIIKIININLTNKYIWYIIYLIIEKGAIFMTIYKMNKFNNNNNNNNYTRLGVL